MRSKSKIRLRYCLSLILVFIVLLFNVSTVVKADMEPEIPESGGFQTDYIINTYLKVVNVTIELYGDVAECKGIYILENPSEINETFDVLFDPGQKPLNATVLINNLSINYTEKNLEEFNRSYDRRDVISFQINIKAHSTLLVNINWEMITKREWSHLYIIGIPIGEIHYTSWSTSYLIIGTRSWGRPIEVVDILFDIRSDKFNDYEFIFLHGDEGRYKKDVEPSNIYKNKCGYDAIHYHFENFTEDSLLIVINTNTISETEPLPECVAIIIIMIIMYMIMFIIIIRSMINQSSE